MSGCQRYTDRRDSRRPPGEPIDTSRYDVAEIAADTTARAFVTRHHYAATYPAARFRFGLHEGGELVGVAVFSHPANDVVITNVFPGCPPTAGAELGRFVLLDRVPGNGETWFLGRCFAALRGRLAGVVSFSDPTPRTTLEGAQVFPGHIGTIYQAHNGEYRGQSKPSTLRLLPDASVFSNRTAGKIARRERGWRYSAAQLERWGADPLGADEDALAWLRRWRPLLTRPMRHPGNHRYVWRLDGAPLTIGPRRAYPKTRAA